MLLHIIFAGRVQGVGFRRFVKNKAYEYGIKGYVRNLPDGTVEVMAEGEEKVLKSFFEEIENGPPLASVNGIRYEFIDKTGGYNDFKIEY